MKDMIQVGCRVSKAVHSEMKKLAEKEKWSVAKVAEVAVEYYLKVRGYDGYETSPK